MASSDAKPIPIKNQAYRVYFPMLKNDGTLITGWSGAAASISKDGATAASATNTPTEIATSFGIGYLDLTSTEMNADNLVIKVTVTNTGALPQLLALYPQEAGDIQVNATYVSGNALATAASGYFPSDVRDWNGSAVATPDTAGYPKITLKIGTGAGELNASSGKVDAQVKGMDNNTLTAAAINDGALTAAKIADNAITAAKIATDAIDADAIAASAASEIGGAVWDMTLASHQTTGTTGKALGSASSAGDPLGSDVPGSYPVGTAGYELGQLDTIKSKVLLITADNVSFTNPVDPLTGDFSVVRGDDYTVTSGRALPEWSSDDWTPFSLTTAASVSFKARTRYDETIFEKAATVLSDTQVRLELTTAETEAFAVGRDAYRFDLAAVLASGDVVTLAQGQMSVIEDVRVG